MRHGKFAHTGALIGALALAAGSWVTTARAADQVTITFWTAYNGAQAAAFNTLAAQFMQAHPTIKVEQVSSANYTALQQKEQSAIFANNTPTGGQAYENWVAEFVQSDAVENLQPYISNKKTGLSSKVIKDFFSGMWQDGLLGKKRLMMPFSKSDMVMYFNGAMLKHYGIKRAPKTWTELQKDCKKLVVMDNGHPVQWCMTVTAAEDVWYVMQHEWGSTVLNKKNQAAFNTKKGVAPVQLMANMIKNHDFVFTTSTNYQDQTDLDTGKSAFDLGSSAGLPYYISGAKPGVSIGEAPVPAGPKGAFTEMYGAPMIIFKKAPQAEKNAAWLFLKYITQPAQTAYWSIHTGYMPVRKSALKLPELMGYFKQNPQTRAAISQLDRVVFEPPIAQWTKARDDITQGITAAYSLNKSASEAMKQAAAQVNSDMGR